MGIAENKALVRRLYDEVVNQGNIEMADKIVSAEAIEHEDLNHNGLDSFKRFFTTFRAAYPDLNFAIEDMIAEGDKVVVRIKVSGTNDGDQEFMGFAPTGKKIEIETIDIFRCENGMITEHWGRTDTLNLLNQLGEEPSQENVAKIRVDP